MKIPGHSGVLQDICHTLKLETLRILLNKKITEFIPLKLKHHWNIMLNMIYKHNLLYFVSLIMFLECCTWKMISGLNSQLFFLVLLLLLLLLFFLVYLLLIYQYFGGLFRYTYTQPFYQFMFIDYGTHFMLLSMSAILVLCSLQLCLGYYSITYLQFHLL